MSDCKKCLAFKPHKDAKVETTHPSLTACSNAKLDANGSCVNCQPDMNTSAVQVKFI